MTLAEDFAERRAKRLTEKWSLWQPLNPNPSDLTDCPIRYQVCRVLCWESKPLPDIAGMEAMEDGTLAEEHVIRQMQDEGWTIVMQQEPFEIKQPIAEGGPSLRILSGKIDGKLKLGALYIPTEIKNTSDYVFARLNDWGDLLQNEWTRKWYRQSQTYALGYDSEYTILVVAHRGKRKLIEVPLDFEFAETLLKACIRAVNIITQMQTWEMVPDDVDRALNETFGVEYPSDYNVCRSCWCRDRCCFPPEPATAEAQIRGDLAELVKEYMEAKPYKSKYERLHKQLKEATEGFPQTLAGDYIIDGKVSTRRMSAKPAVGARVLESWSIEVRKVGEK